MGQTPAKTFNMPTPFGASPQTNNLTQAQAVQRNQGPGYAALGAFDQTQAAPQQPVFAQSPAQYSYGDTAGYAPRRNLMTDFNPFRGMLDQ